MVDLLYAKQNISKYKFDYLGYEVIVDSIRIDEVLNSNVTKEMQRFLKYLIEKYKQQIDIIQKNHKAVKLTEKTNKKNIILYLEYLKDILPAIGFINLGLEKQIGIELSIPKKLFI